MKLNPVGPNQTKTPTPGIYRLTPAGGIKPIVPATFVTIFYGYSRGVPQYAVERAANSGTAIAWVNSLEEGRYLCRLLNGGLPVSRK